MAQSNDASDAYREGKQREKSKRAGDGVNGRKGSIAGDLLLLGDDGEAVLLVLLALLFNLAISNSNNKIIS